MAPKEKKVTATNGHGRTARPGRSPLNEKRYEEIVEVAGRLFATQGFDGTSLQDISEHVGVLKGSLYHYISSKEDLLEEVVRSAQQGLLENMALCDHFKGRPLAQLVAFSYGHVVLNATPERVLRAAVFLQDGDKLSPSKREPLVAGRNDYDRYLRRILKDGRETAVFDPDVEPRSCSFAIIGVLTSYIRWYRPGGRVTSHELGREFAAFVLAGVREHIAHGRGYRWDVVDPVIEQCQRYLDAETSVGADGA
jgi:TetR/AcrR family transcriptional regulator, cholesterol catabolism regulator